MSRCCCCCGFCCDFIFILSFGFLFLAHKPVNWIWFTIYNTEWAQVDWKIKHFHSYRIFIHEPIFNVINIYCQIDFHRQLNVTFYALSEDDSNYFLLVKIVNWNLVVLYLVMWILLLRYFVFTQDNNIDSSGKKPQITLKITTNQYENHLNYLQWRRRRRKSKNRM